MFQKRRNFVVTMLSSLGLVNKVNAVIDNKTNSKKYKVRYECLFLEGRVNYETFEVDRLVWEKPDEMVAFIQEYVRENKIISTNFRLDKNKIQWDYVFVNRSSFEKFNKDVFLKGYFDQQKVLKGYEYRLSGEYV